MVWNDFAVVLKQQTGMLKKYQMHSYEMVTKERGAVK